MEIDYIKRGDCIKYMKNELPDNSVDVVFTSPPYNRLRNDTYDYYDENLVDYFKLLTDFTDESLRVAKDKVIVNLQQNYYNKVEVYKYFGRYSQNIAGVVIWNKTNPKPVRNYCKEDNTRSITNSFEYFIVLTKDGKKFRCYGDENTFNYITTSVNTSPNSNHRAVMHKGVCEWFIEKFTKEGDVVLDPFLGTGTTAVCAIEKDRHYIGYEISEEYFNESVINVLKARQNKHKQNDYEQFTFDDYDWK